MAAQLKWGLWLYGLFAGFIGGGAGAFASGVAATWLAPESFGASQHFGHLLALIGITFFLSGLTHFFAYLAQHPLPDWDGTTDRRGAPPAP